MCLCPRRGRREWPAVYRDGADAGVEPARPCARQRAARSRRCRPQNSRRHRRIERSASPGRDPSRREAVQLLPGGRRTGESRGLRALEVADKRLESNANRLVSGHAAIRVARADQGRPGRSSNGCLFRRGHAVFRTHGPRSVPGNGRSGDLGENRLRPAPSMRSFRPELPAELDRIVLRALDRNRDRRYRTMADFASALQAFAPEGSQSRASASESRRTSSMSCCRNMCSSRLFASSRRS